MEQKQFPKFKALVPEKIKEFSRLETFKYKFKKCKPHCSFGYAKLICNMLDFSLNMHK